MKNNTTTLTLVVFLSILIGCSKFADKIDDFNIGITNTIFEQSAVIELKDYFGNNEDIINTDFNIAFGGMDADKLVSEAGELTISETNGFIQLNVNPNKSKGVKELNFDITISGGDYNTETFPITLTDPVSHIRLPLINESKIYKGTNTITQSAALTNNTIATDITLKTNKTTSLNKSAVTLKTGTQFKDISGNTLMGSDINIELTNTDAASQNLQFTDNLTFKDVNGVEITGKTARFIAGNTHIKMNIDGTSIKEFDTSINVYIEIPSDATNPLTSTPVQLGDDFPIYTSEDNSTLWTYHGIGKVVAGETTSFFNISFETTHLSDYAALKFEDIDCNTNERSHNLTATNLPNNFSGFLEVEWWQTKISTTIHPIEIFSLFSVQVQNGEIIWSTANLNHNNTLARYKSNFNWKRINDFIASGEDKLYQSTFGLVAIDQLVVKLNGVPVRDNISDIATIANCELAINFTRDLIPNIDNLKSISIDVASSCNGNTFVPDGFPFYVLRENGQYSYEGTIRKGKMTLNGFEIGKEYTFKTVYKGETFINTWTFDSENFIDHNFNIPDEACNKLGF